MVYSTSTGNYMVSRFIVDNVGFSPFTTIQQALDQANSESVRVSVVVRPGTYNENLTLYDGINLIAVPKGEVTVVGDHTPPASGSMNFEGFNLNSATDILSSAVAGTTNLSFYECTFNLTNGFIFNLPNWSGTLFLEDCQDNSTANGIINNAGSAPYTIKDSNVGISNTFTADGTGTIQGCIIGCPTTFPDGAAGSIYSSVFSSTITLTGLSNVNIFNSHLSPSGLAAINQTGTGDLTISNTTIDTSNNPAIDGTGSVITGIVTFLDDADIADTITLTRDLNLETTLQIMNGAFVESPVIDVTSDGATITFSLEQSGGGDLTGVFSTGYHLFDTTPAATVSLTAGTDTVPQINYVYIPESTNALTVSTSNWPSAEHIPLATVYCQSAASIQTDGPYKVHAWTDHFRAADNQGHMSDINFWIRQQHATWVSGDDYNLTITANAGAADNVIFTITNTGTVLQLHEHAFPTFLGTPDVYTVNDFTTPFNKVTDLNALLTDSTNVSMAGRYFSLVIWGVVSEDLADCKLMVNLPSGSYNTQSELDEDISNFADYTIPGEFKGTGFLIAQLNLRHQVAASGTWTSIETIDLRGQLPTTAAGGGSAPVTEFPDNTFRIFDNADDSKKIAFEASGITTSTVRTFTVPNASGTMGLVTGLATNGMAYASDANTVTSTAQPTDGQLLIGDTGSNPILGNIASADGSITITNGAGTIDLSVVGTGMPWTEVTSASTNANVDNGYITNRGGGVTVNLPNTAAIGSIVRIAGKAGLWTLGQNAGETVYIGDTNTTTGAGGSLAATNAGDCVEVVCITANTDWRVLSSVGNLTVT